MTYTISDGYPFGMFLFCNEAATFLNGDRDYSTTRDNLKEDMCPLYHPVATMNGICFSFNALPIHQVLHLAYHLSDINIYSSFKIF